jgi:HK97 family phage major capsid protein
MMVAFDGFLRKGDEKLSADERKSLLVSNDTTGGYLAPPQMAADIIKAEVLYTPVRELVTVQPTAAAEFQQPKRTGTAAATRQGETGTRSETQNPAWGMMKIPAPELYAEARVTWANLEDSAFNLESMLARSSASSSA